MLTCPNNHTRFGLQSGNGASKIVNWKLLPSVSLVSSFHDFENEVSQNLIGVPKRNFGLTPLKPPFCGGGKTFHVVFK